MARLAKSITRVVRRSDDTRSVTSLRGKKKKKRRLSSWAKPHDKARRYLLEALGTYAEVALAEHHKANKKKKNGSLRNTAKVHRRAVKQAKKKIKKIK